MNPELKKVHLDLAIASRAAASALRYTLPKTASRIRTTMRRHALQSRGAEQIGGTWYTPRKEGILSPAGHALP